MEGWIGDVGSIYTYGFNVFENPVVAPIPIPGIEVRPAPDLIPQNIAVTADGPIQSGGQVTIAWQTRNDGNVAATGTWSDRVILRNVRSEEHTSELQSLMRIQFAVFCLKQNKTQ